MAVKGKKTKKPSFFSQEFLIQNHADIVAIICTIFIVGLMVEFLHPISSSFIAPQHNVTFEEELDDYGNPLKFYRPGPKDMLAVFFYTLIMILAHAVIQEFILDKFNKKLHLSKVKFSKFNESGQLLAFYIFSAGYAFHLLIEYVSTEDSIQAFISSLWTYYPQQHALMPWHVKVYYILQLAYWLHVFPELYLQKTKKEEMPAKIQYASLYFAVIFAGYIMYYQRIMLILLAHHYVVEAVFHAARILYFLDKVQPSKILFGLWAILFSIVRLASVVLSVLTFWFGFARVHEETQSLSTSLPVRLSTLCAICCLQAWMTWNFVTFQMKRAMANQDTSKAASVPKKSTKSANGVASAKKKN